MGTSADAHGSWTQGLESNAQSIRAPSSRSILTTLASWDSLNLPSRPDSGIMSRFSLYGSALPQHRLAPASLPSVSAQVTSVCQVFSNTLTWNSNTCPKSAISFLLIHIAFLLFVTLQLTAFTCVLTNLVLLNRLGFKLHEGKVSVLVTNTSSGSAWRLTSVKKNLSRNKQSFSIISEKKNHVPIYWYSLKQMVCNHLSGYRREL